MLGVLLLFSGCGEMDSLFAPGEGYQVTALVNGSSLEGCSIIRSGDKIRPHFAVPVENDPDLIGLLVYVQNLLGNVIGDQIMYILQPYYNSAAQTKTRKNSEIEGTGESGSGRQANWDSFVGDLTVKERWDTEENPPVVVSIRSLGQEIPYFALPENMEIGPYKLVFEAIGKKETLHKTESDIFFLSTTEFQVKDISIYLPKVSDTQMIAPGTTVMLESRLDFDSSLEPYVIWYDGRNIISEGKMSEGAGTIFWKAPERAGFYSMRLEVFPFQLGGNYAGIVREITLPVSSKTTTTGGKGYFFGDYPEYAPLSPLATGTIFPERERARVADSVPVALERPALLRWYKFEGDLYDTLAGFGIEESLVSGSNKAPLWAAAGHTYGLSTGPEDPYLLSPTTFFLNTDNQGGGMFLFHIRSLAEGTIFSTFFPLQLSEVEGVTMDVLRRGNAIVLRLSTKETAVEMPVYLPPFELQTFIPAAVEFFIRHDRLEAKMSLGNNARAERLPLPSVSGNIRLSDTLAGEARIRLGGGAEQEQGMAEEDTAFVSPANRETYRQVVLANTIWDEFAVLSSSLPIQEEEIVTVIIPVKKTTPIAEMAKIGAEEASRSGIRAGASTPGTVPDEPEAAKTDAGTDDTAQPETRPSLVDNT